MAGDPGRQVGPSRGGSRPRTWHSRQVRHVLRHLWDRWAARHPRVASGPGQRRYLRNLRRFRYSAGRCGSPLPPSRQRSGAPVFHTNPRARPLARDERSRHLPEARRPEAAGPGWETEPHSIAEQRTVTDGRIVPSGKGFIRRPPKRVDYLLRYTRDFPLAVIEAKADYKLASDGLQQAKDYATMLGLKFAYATNGQEIVEFDFLTGLERNRTDYPAPEDLWGRYRAAARLSDPQADQLLAPFNHAVA